MNREIIQFALNFLKSNLEDPEVEATLAAHLDLAVDEESYDGDKHNEIVKLIDEAIQPDVEVDEDGTVKKAEYNCFVLTYEDIEDKLDRKITPDEWAQICVDFEMALQEDSNWNELLNDTLESNDLLHEYDEDEDEDDDDDDDDEE